MSRERKPAYREKGPVFLTAQQVAERYGRPLKWVYSCEKLPRLKIGKYLFFPEDQLPRFEEYRSQINRGHFMRQDTEVVTRQNATKRLKFDIL